MPIEIKKYEKLLDELNLPADTPYNLVIELFEELEAKNIDRSDVEAVDKELKESALWQWASVQEIDIVKDLSDELPLARLIQRIISQLGI